MRKVTEKQQKAVRYCEKWLYVEFEGDINDFYDCSSFLSMYLEDAKQAEFEYTWLASSYISL